MAVTKTTNLVKVEVYPGDTTLENYEPFMVVTLQDVWDDPDDDELPLTKLRVERRGRAYDPEVPNLKTDISDWPTLAQDIAKKVWRY
tara:strand:+ start:313 stop:573 length:261 start_codon:yes stop_codon:yes gene_type:complete